MKKLDSFVFANTSSAGTSNAYYNASGDTMVLTVEGTASAFSFYVEGQSDTSDSNTWEHMFAISIGGAMSDISVYRDVTTKGIYSVDLTGIEKVRVHIASVTGGNLKIFGRVTTSGEVY